MLDDQTDHAYAQTPTLDSVVKCIQGQLAPPTLLETLQNLLESPRQSDDDGPTSMAGIPQHGIIWGNESERNREND